jgi:hypothetical protein
MTVRRRRWLIGIVSVSLAVLIGLLVVLTSSSPRAARGAAAGPVQGPAAGGEPALLSGATGGGASASGHQKASAPAPSANSSKLSPPDPGGSIPPEDLLANDPNNRVRGQLVNDVAATPDASLTGRR